MKSNNVIFIYIHICTNYLLRVAAIDKHLLDLYGARYAKFRTSNQYKEILNKKCSRIRTKFNKSIDNN